MSSSASTAKRYASSILQYSQSQAIGMANGIASALPKDMQALSTGVTSIQGSLSGMAHGIANALPKDMQALSTGMTSIQGSLSGMAHGIATVPGSIANILPKDAQAVRQAMSTRFASIQQSVSALELRRPTKREVVIVAAVVTGAAVAVLVVPPLVTSVIGISTIGPTAGGLVAAAQSAGFSVAVIQSMAMGGMVGAVAATKVGLAVGGAYVGREVTSRFWRHRSESEAQPTPKL